MSLLLESRICNSPE